MIGEFLRQHAGMEEVTMWRDKDGGWYAEGEKGDE